MSPDPAILFHDIAEVGRETGNKRISTFYHSEISTIAKKVRNFGASGTTDCNKISTISRKFANMIGYGNEWEMPTTFDFSRLSGHNDKLQQVTKMVIIPS